jgi:hypothetical protein
MDIIQECAFAFQKLLSYEYHFVIGRKGKMKEFYLNKADYLLEGQPNSTPSYLFLGKRNKGEMEQMCRTFFKIEDKDYTEGQARYTLLKKEKKDLSSGTIVIQYDRLTPKEMSAPRV